MVNDIENIIFIAPTFILWKIIWILLAPNWTGFTNNQLKLACQFHQWPVNFTHFGVWKCCIPPSNFNGTIMILEWVGLRDTLQTNAQLTAAQHGPWWALWIAGDQVLVMRLAQKSLPGFHVDLNWRCNLSLATGSAAFLCVWSCFEDLKPTMISPEIWLGCNHQTVVK